VEGITPGRALDEPKNWLIAVSDTCLMKALSVCYIFKRLPMQDALNFCQHFGIPTVHGETKAAFGSDDWKRFVQALQEFANTQSIATAIGDKINVLANSAANGEAVFGWIIDAMKRAMVTICCGSDLATMSRENGAGASLQGDDADELTADFCDFITELFNEQLDRRVIEMEFGEGVEPLAFFKLIPPQNQDAELEMKIDDHVSKYGVMLSVADVAERYSRTHDESAADVESEDEFEDEGDAANEAALQTLPLNSAAAFRAGVRRDLRPLNEALLPLVNARGANESRAAFLALNERAIEGAVLDGDASTAALEVSLATEFLRGLAFAGDDVEGANSFNPMQPRDRFGQFASFKDSGDWGGGGFSDGDIDAANAWRPSEDEMNGHLRAGRSAMEHCMDRREDQLAAVNRPGIGPIDFIWGKAGEPPSFSTGHGVAKIIAKRNHEAKINPKLKGQSGKNIARAMVETLLKGHVGKPYASRQGSRGQRVNVSWRNFTATLDASHGQNGRRWLLTGFINLNE